MDRKHVDYECDSYLSEVKGKEIVFACEHKNIFDPAPSDPNYVRWCVDCGAIQVSDEEWLVPGHNKYAVSARG